MLGGLPLPAIVKARILTMVPEIARLLFAKYSTGSLTSTKLNDHPRDGTHLDESPTVYRRRPGVSQVGSPRQFRII